MLLFDGLDSPTDFQFHLFFTQFLEGLVTTN